MRKRWEAAPAQNAQAPLPFRPGLRRAHVLRAGRAAWRLTHRFSHRRLPRVALRQPPGDCRRITWLRSDAVGALRGGKPRAPHRLIGERGACIRYQALYWDKGTSHTILRRPPSRRRDFHAASAFLSDWQTLFLCLRVATRAWSRILRSMPRSASEAPPA